MLLRLLYWKDFRSVINWGNRHTYCTIYRYCTIFQLNKEQAFFIRPPLNFPENMTYFIIMKKRKTKKHIAFFIYIYKNLKHFRVQNLPDFLKSMHFLQKICIFLPKTCNFLPKTCNFFLKYMHFSIHVLKRLNRGRWYAF